MDVQTIKRKRNIYLYVSAVSLLVLGLVYAWSLFATPLATMYGWEMEAVKLTFTICMISFCVGGLIGVPVLKRFGVKGAILLSAAMLACGFAGTALLAPKGIWALYICYGVLTGGGTGLGYNVIIASVTLWFPDKTGYASGVMMMGFGLGSLILGTVANAIIEGAGLTSALFAIAAIGAVFMVLLALLIKSAPENITEILGIETKAEVAAETAADKRGLFTDPAFYSYYIWAIIVIGAGLAMIGTSKQGAIALDVNATFATTLVGIISIVNGLSRLAMGVIYDKTNLRFAMILSAIVTVVACAALALSFAMGIGLLYIAGCLVLVFSYGSVPPIAAGFARERYGAKRFPRNLAIVNTDIAGGSAFQQAVSTATAGASIAIYTAMALFGVVATVVGIIFARITK